MSLLPVESVVHYPCSALVALTVAVIGDLVLPFMVLRAEIPFDPLNTEELAVASIVIKSVLRVSSCAACEASITIDAVILLPVDLRAFSWKGVALVPVTI